MDYNHSRAGAAARITMGWSNSVTGIHPRARATHNDGDPYGMAYSEEAHMCALASDVGACPLAAAGRRLSDILCNSGFQEKRRRSRGSVLVCGSVCRDALMPLFPLLGEEVVFISGKSFGVGLIVKLH